MYKTTNLVTVARPASSGEANDCSVRALSNATGWDYQKAWTIMALAGRKPGRGAVMSSAWPFMRKAGFTVTWINDSQFTLGRFARTMGSSGRYIVQVVFRNRLVGHVFAVVDGKVYDDRDPSYRGDYLRIDQIWKLEAVNVGQ